MRYKRLLPVHNPMILAVMLALLSTGCAELHKTHQKDSKITSNTSIQRTTPHPSHDIESGPIGETDPLNLNAISIEKSNDIEYLPLVGTNTDSGKPAPKDTETEAVQSRFDQALEFYQASQDFWQQGELDSALHALDEAYGLILEGSADDLPNLNQQRDDLRFMISKRILEIYASRHITAQGNHNAIPMVMNDHVQKEIDQFTAGKGREFFISSYQRSGRYRPYILQELKEAGLPEELSWLPLIESGFKARALSNARALGLWQFISSTGYKFGLKRNLYIDDRLDPYKSTEAAISYLKELHEIFGDWMTVLAAYNCGEGRVLRTIRDQNVNYLDDFWDLYQRLPFETARYVPKFLATLHIVNNPEKYGLSSIVPDAPMNFEVVAVSRQAYLKDIAKALNTTETTLTDLNPELRYKLLPPEEYPLKIPPGNETLLLAGLKDIPEYSNIRPGITYHRVMPGETLSTIARRYHIEINELAVLNNIYRKNYIVAGKILKIPQSGRFASTQGEPKIISYRVRQGDSLWTLAKRYDTTTKKIQEINNLNTVNLSIDQVLKIPVGSQYGLEVYRVQGGDTPYLIAKRFNMSLNRLLSLNHLTKNSTIYPGQQLYVE
jgi:membrane-bound lytic murein transglycosylase D